MSTTKCTPNLTPRAVIIGAGVGGLAAAIDLAAAGFAVTVVEKQDQAGGKMRNCRVGAADIDGGPTVFTMRWVFDTLFADAGAIFAGAVTLEAADILARHAWDDASSLDLYADLDRSADAIGGFAGAAAARGFRRFSRRAARVYQALEKPFMVAPRPSLPRLCADAGWRGMLALTGAPPFMSLWSALAMDLRDPRLRQLFARYATYSGASPFSAPAILMLIAHAEQQGVWLVRGGMKALAAALVDLLRKLGGKLRLGEACGEILADGRRATGIRLASGEVIEADAVVCNADAAALGLGIFGAAASRGLAAMPLAQRGLSAATWAMVAECQGFPLARHSVFFARDYAAEFRAVFAEHRIGDDPTVYICAQDRSAGGERQDGGAERLLVLVNAPANGDTVIWNDEKMSRARLAALGVLQRCGLHLKPETELPTSPQDFADLFPGTGGALYGRALHGPWAAFRRPLARATLPGLYLAGGSVHPGPGVPMAALSGRLAASAIRQDYASTHRLHQVAMPGGMLTPSATMASTR
jgi:1-hydroxycarotenoid 3,4-desaturase